MGTAVAAAALGATMAWGLTMASASAGTAGQSVATHSAVTSAGKATPPPAKGTAHHCTHMPSRSGAPSSTPGAMPG